MGLLKKLIALGVIIPPNYFIYREFKKKRDFKTNIFLEESQVTQLKNKENLAISQYNKPIQLHPVNHKFQNNQEKILIIGGGIVGITQAFMLCQNTNANVILIEKDKDIGLYSSYANGAIFQLYQSWMNKDLIKDLVKSFFSESRVTMKAKGFLTPNIIEWGLNMLYNISDKKFQQNNNKLKEIIKVTQNEFDKMLDQKVLTKQDVDSNATGTIYVYKTPNALSLVKNKKTIAWKRSQGFNVQTLKNKEEIVAQEPYLKNTDKFMDSGILSQGIDKNINTYKLLTSLSKYNKKHHESRYDELYNTEFQKFLIRDIDKKVIGVMTNKGVILADKVIVCGGIFTQNIIKKLGIIFPLSPMRGYTVTVPVAPGTPTMRNMVVFSEDYFYQTQLNNDYRISMFNDIVGHDLTPDKKRAAKVLDNAETMIGKKFFNRNEAKLWTGIRPVSPDDVPILGPFKKFPNVYVNAGHGSKGMGTSLGCAKLIQEQISNIKRSINEKDYSYSRFFLL